MFVVVWRHLLFFCIHLWCKCTNYVVWSLTHKKKNRKIDLVLIDSTYTIIYVHLAMICSFAELPIIIIIVDFVIISVTSPINLDQHGVFYIMLEIFKHLQNLTIGNLLSLCELRKQKSMFLSSRKTIFSD